MKILYAITKSNFGGAGRYVLELASTAKRQSYDVAVMCGGKGLLVQEFANANIKVISIPQMKRNISMMEELYSLYFIFRTLKSEKPDIFHTNSSKMGGLGAVAARFAGINKIIFTSHGWAFNELRPGWQKMLIKFFAWLTILISHKTICVSEKTRKDISNWPFIKGKLLVIYNGISGFDLAQRQSDLFVVGAVSELHRIKGLDILLKAWSRFAPKHPARLILIGEGEERENLENLTTQLDIADSVKFMGFVDNARSRLSLFDVFIMPSRSEALPYALLEAGFASLPSIASRVGGIPEIIKSGDNGILIPSEDPETLLSSLILLYENPDLRKRLGENLKLTIQTKFSFDKMIEKTFALYGRN